MVKRIGGSRRKTRSIFKKEPRNRGKFSLTDYFQTFKKGDQVQMKVEPAIHKGVHYKRFESRSGVIIGTQGRCYTVKIDDFGKPKTLIVHPIHLRRLK